METIKKNWQMILTAFSYMATGLLTVLFILWINNVASSLTKTENNDEVIENKCLNGETGDVIKRTIPILNNKRLLTTK